MRSLIVAVAVVAASAGLALGSSGSAGAAQRSCGSVSLFGTPVQLVVLRGATCATAKRITRGIHDGGAQRAGWTCALAHAPFTKIDGREVAFSCGKGGHGGNLRDWPHAFVGAVNPAGTTPAR